MAGFHTTVVAAAAAPPRSPFLGWYIHIQVPPSPVIWPGQNKSCLACEVTALQSQAPPLLLEGSLQKMDDWLASDTKPVDQARVSHQLSAHLCLVYSPVTFYFFHSLTCLSWELILLKSHTQESVSSSSSWEPGLCDTILCNTCQIHHRILENVQLK